MVGDGHAHCIPKDFSDFLGDRLPTRVDVPVKRGIRPSPGFGFAGGHSGPARIDGYGEGVQRQVLSPNYPPYLPDENECVTAIRMMNDGYAELAQRYPQRIASYIMLI
jgi:hypothetical protein